MSYSLTAPQVARMLGHWRAQGPAYLDLAGAFEVLIADGRLPAGARIPAERALATQCGISRNTVTAAYRLLRERGRLASDRGAGSFVRAPRAARSVQAAAASTVGRHPGTDVDLTVDALPIPQGVLVPAVREVSADLGRYADGLQPGHDLMGLPELRREIAAGFTQRGVPTGPEEILVTGGAEHGLGLVLRLLSRPGEAVLTDSPTHPAVLDLTRALNRRLLTVGLAPDGWDADVWESVLHRERPRLAYLAPDFHHPTGMVMPAAIRAAIARAAVRSGTHLVVDESVRDLALDGPPLPPPLAGPQVITVGTLSSSCWAGLRVGWIRAAEPVVTRLAGLRHLVDGGNSLLTQLVGLRVLESYPPLLAERRQLLLHRRLLLAELLAEYLPDWRYRLPHGGLALWVDLGHRVGPPLARAAAERGVRVLTGGRFGVDGTFEDHLRIPFTADESALESACARLARAWQDVGRAGTARHRVHAAA
ncbi:PLP-dependent aminotransferase family protein [Kitasatospora sp. NPDC096147]|uniref:aminotransferase-like domain-containing protein n=1 Tax=Kitasatospora sp. NPDC096147 TaxID=3364093 RepID=UPI00382F4D7E